MTGHPTHGWCPSCKEESAIAADRRCMWCGEETRKRGRGGKPKGVHGKLEDRHLRALHRLHSEQGLSLRELGRRIWEKAGYANAHSAGMAISYGFRRLGLPALSQAEATARANEARRAADSPGTADRSAYKKWRRRQKGGYRACKGIKRQPPGKGQPCTRWALVGSDYCYAHDPSRREEIVTHAAEMRSRIGAAA